MPLKSPHNHCLLSLVLYLEFVGKTPVRAAKWYGRAAQKYFLDAIGDAASAELVDSAHDGHERRPYTTSTLFGFNKSDNGMLLPGRTLSLRITAYSDQIISALQWATQPGGLMGVGTGVSLADHLFRVTGMNAEVPPGRYTSYQVIWDHYHNASNISADPVHIKIESPAYFESVDFTSLVSLKGPDGNTKAMMMEVNKSVETLIHHLPLPVFVFGGLFDKWNRFSPVEYHLPAAFLKVVATEVFPQKADLESAAVRIFDQGTHHIGCKGNVFYNTGEKSSLDNKRYMLILAAFSQFAGIGKDTTMGFGQCSHYS